MKKYLFLLPLTCLAFAGCNSSDKDSNDSGTPVDKTDSTALTEFAAKVGSGAKASYDALKTGVELNLEVSLEGVAFHLYTDGMNIDIASESLSFTVDAKAVNLGEDSSKWEASAVVGTKGVVTYSVGDGVNEPVASGSLNLNDISAAAYLKAGNLYFDLSNEKISSISETIAAAADLGDFGEIKEVLSSILTKGYLPEFMDMVLDDPITLPELDATVPSYISAGLVTLLEEAKNVEELPGLYEAIQLLSFKDGGFGISVSGYTIAPSMGEHETLSVNASASVTFDKDALLSSVKAGASVSYESVYDDESISVKGSVSAKVGAKFGITDAGIPALDEFKAIEF